MLFAGNAEEISTTASTIGTTEALLKRYKLATSTMGALLAGIGWLCIGLAFRGNDARSN